MQGHGKEMAFIHNSAKKQPPRSPKPLINIHSDSSWWLENKKDIRHSDRLLVVGFWQSKHVDDNFIIYYTVSVLKWVCFRWGALACQHLEQKSQVLNKEPGFPKKGHLHVLVQSTWDRLLLSILFYFPRTANENTASATEMTETSEFFLQPDPRLQFDNTMLVFYLEVTTQLKFLNDYR